MFKNKISLKLKKGIDFEVLLTFLAEEICLGKLRRRVLFICWADNILKMFLLAKSVGGVSRGNGAAFHPNKFDMDNFWNFYFVKSNKNAPVECPTFWVNDLLLCWLFFLYSYENDFINKRKKHQLPGFEPATS